MTDFNPWPKLHPAGKSPDPITAGEIHGLRVSPMRVANTGHGHVTPRPDGVKAWCGGPNICEVCAREAQALHHAASAVEAIDAFSLATNLGEILPAMVEVERQVRAVFDKRFGGRELPFDQAREMVFLERDIVEAAAAALVSLRSAPFK